VDAEKTTRMTRSRVDSQAIAIRPSKVAQRADAARRRLE